MGKMFAYRFLIRVGSLLMASVSAFACHFVTVYPGWMVVAGRSLYCGCLILLFYPVGDENPKDAWLQSVLGGGMLAFAAFVPSVGNLIRLTLVPVLLSLLLFVRRRTAAPAVRTVNRASRDRIFMEWESRLWYALLVLCLQGVLGGIMLAPVYVLLYVRAYFGRLLYVPDGSCQKKVRVYEETLDILFARVKDLMETNRHFLDPKCSLSNTARLVLTNRKYLSDAVNSRSGKNFKTFVNQYRINHARYLMENNPGLNIKQLAFMCGFNSLVTFESAFKLQVGITPKQYQEGMVPKSGFPLSVRDG